ncbi:hypothetical protein P3H15_38365 [Rhodococcus sp. T2V]|uniref:nucleoside hydrolase n=1 Tax=Rhodococcus sp. T2V TaxID=3034164 RepID=UPI0023E207FB|nr:nucleoside hydrolase [Rhodococcus sp. T2V]MDF3310876.1 hypothetical protein [Rhodococcus sp. T2V]
MGADLLQDGDHYGGMGPVARWDTETAVQPLFLVKGDTNTNQHPDAAASVAAAHGPATLVGMNVTGRLRVLWDDLDTQAEQTGLAAFVRDITAGYHLYCTTTYRSDTPMYTSHDSVAASVMLDPAVVWSVTDLTGHVHRGDDGRASLWGHPAGRPRPMGLSPTCTTRRSDSASQRHAAILYPDEPAGHEKNFDAHTQPLGPIVRVEGAVGFTDQAQSKCLALARRESIMGKCLVSLLRLPRAMSFA